jgi:hypothetical protein
MRIIGITAAALSLLAITLVQPGATPAQAQSAPVLKEQTPSQADQSRAQDRAHAQDVKIGRDWKAKDTDRNHDTIGRDWRAHPKAQDR